MAAAPRPRWGFRGSHGQPGHGGDVTGGRAVRGNLLVGVAVVDGTGEGVQLLQGDANLRPHVVGDKVPAGHAEKENKYVKRCSQTQTILLWSSCSCSHN